MKKLLLISLLLAAALARAADGEEITMYKDPYCGCCSAWVTYMREAGYSVKVADRAEMASVKEKFKVPAELASCHTAVVERTGQVIEGHVPAAAVKKLLAAPSVRGVAVPGMPMNAPGMGALDGQLTTLDFEGKPFSKD